MTQDEFRAKFKDTWTREASQQFGMVLDVLPVNENLFDEEKAA